MPSGRRGHQPGMKNRREIKIKRVRAGTGGSSAPSGPNQRFITKLKRLKSTFPPSFPHDPGDRKSSASLWVWGAGQSESNHPSTSLESSFFFRRNGNISQKQHFAEVAEEQKAAPGSTEISARRTNFCTIHPLFHMTK